MIIRDRFGLAQRNGQVGIEIEMEGAGLPGSTGTWKSTRDGSLRGEAVEYVLAAPVLRDQVPKVLNMLQNKLKVAQLEPSDRCGVHVHINCQELTQEEVIKFACLYLILEDVLVRFCGEDREGNLFCLRSRDAEDLTLTLSNLIREDGDLWQMRGDGFRYASINFAALAKYGSLEFRALRTPRNFTKINTWVEMLLKVKDASAEFDTVKAMVEGVSIQGAEQFISMVLRNMTDHVLYRDVDQMVMEGVRRVQDIAYAADMPIVVKKKPKKKKPIEEDMEKLWMQFNQVHNLPPNAVHVPPRGWDLAED